MLIKHNYEKDYTRKVIVQKLSDSFMTKIKLSCKLNLLASVHTQKSR